SRRPRLKPGLQHLGRAARGGPRCCATLDPPSVVPIRPVYAVQRVSHCSAWTSGLTGEGRLGRLTATPGGPAPTRAGRWAAAGKIHGETGVGQPPDPDPVRGLQTGQPASPDPKA